MTARERVQNFIRERIFQNQQPQPQYQEVALDIPEYDVNGFYQDKVLFCTGCTGFLGKVMLEKVLRCLPHVKKIYLLMRPKKEMSIGERLEKEVFSSKIFDRLRAEMGAEKFEEYVHSKVTPVGGDVATEEYFLYDDDQETRNNGTTIDVNSVIRPKKMKNDCKYKTTTELIKQLKEEVNVVIHVAATIGFHERLDRAIQLNTFGTFRTMMFAKQCKNIQSFCHVSTCYVNSNQKSGSTVIERQYLAKFPKNESVEDFCNRVLAMDLKDIENTSKKTLKFFKYPNTYTFTKWMGEQLIMKHRGDLPVAVVRPSIIGCAHKEPVPAWIDAVSAGGAVFFFSGLGMCSIMPGVPDNIADQIPVDYVANGMLMCTAAMGIEGQHLAKLGKPMPMRTFHVGTSSKHPVSWEFTRAAIIKYWESHRPKRAMADPELHIITNRALFMLRFFFAYTAITKSYGAMARITKKPEHQKNAKLLKWVEGKASFLDQSFKHFTMNEWIFDVTNLEHVYMRLPAEQKKVFYMDFNEIDWGTYFHYYGWGLQKYVLKEDPQPATRLNLTLSGNAEYFSDINFATNANIIDNTQRSRPEIMEAVLSSSKVQQQIQLEAQRKSLKFADVEDRARAIMNQMFAEMTPAVVRFLSYLFRKIWRSMYHSIMVDDNEIEKIRALNQNEANGPVVIIPTHRSYIDFLIMTYIFIAKGIPIPHIAAGEDFLNMYIVRDIFRYCGAFFIRRSFGTDELYKSIFSEYVKELLIDHCNIEFFVEGTRSRSGKTLHPKMGLLSVIAESFLDRKVPNMTVLPVYIGYEKVLESESYSNELLGGQKKGESLSNLIKATNVIFNKYGAINVRFAEPISMRKFTEDIAAQSGGNFDPFLNAEDKKELVQRLGWKVAYDLNEAAVVMPTALVATIMLAFRNGISYDELLNKMMWMKHQIDMRGGRLIWDTGSLKESTSAVLERSLKLISNCVSRPRKSNIVELNLGLLRNNHKSIIQLHIYRNQVIHYFVSEGFISCALASLYQNKPIETELVVQQATFLEKLLAKEFVLSPNPNHKEDHMATIELMVSRGLLEYRGENKELIAIPNGSMDSIYFICSMFWPFIEGYWTTALSLFAVQRLHNEQNVMKSSIPVDIDMHGPSLSQEEKEMGAIKDSALQTRVSRLAEKLFSEHQVVFYESAIVEIIKNALETFGAWKVIQKFGKKITTQVKGKEVTQNVNFVKLLPPYTSVDEIMKLVDKIGRFRKISNKAAASGVAAAPVAALTHNATSNARATIATFVPIISKL